MAFSFGVKVDLCEKFHLLLETLSIFSKKRGMKGSIINELKVKEAHLGMIINSQNGGGGISDGSGAIKAFAFSK
jgi:hypothetical protein